MRAKLAELFDPDAVARVQRWGRSEVGRIDARSRQLFRDAETGHALREAGCENELLLWHCRSPVGTHARGSWLVERLRQSQPWESGVSRAGWAQIHEPGVICHDSCTFRHGQITSTSPFLRVVLGILSSCLTGSSNPKKYRSFAAYYRCRISGTSATRKLTRVRSTGYSRRSRNWKCALWGDQWTEPIRAGQRQFQCGPPVHPQRVVGTKHPYLRNAGNHKPSRRHPYSLPSYYQVLCEGICEVKIFQNRHVHRPGRLDPAEATVPTMCQPEPPAGR